MSHLGLKQPWLVRHNAQLSPPTVGNIYCGIHQHNSISSWDQLCQDSRVGTAQFQPWNAMPRQYCWHLSGDMASTQREYRYAFDVCDRYLVEYYQLWDTAARWTDSLNNWSSVSWWVPILLAHTSLWQEADLVFLTTYSPCSSCCILSPLQSLQGVPFQVSVHLKWEMCQPEPNRFENIPVL